MDVDLGDFVSVTHIVNNDKHTGEIVAFDDDGYFVIMVNGYTDYYLYGGHYHVKKLSNLEIELL